jgi:predicted lactoylglutathione lyase
MSVAPTKIAKLISSAPVLFVRDIYAATAHYRDAMGFSFDEIFGEPPSFAILRRDNMYVMLKQIADHKYIVPR